MRLMRITVVWVSAGILVLGLANAASAQPTLKREPAKALWSVDGAENYAAYCAVCHGKDGKGRGPAAPALKTAPTDLTAIASSHGGVFSVADVEAAVKGSGRPIAAHGTADMPVWGPIFRSMSPGDDMLALRLSNLVQYIKSMQAK